MKNYNVREYGNTFWNRFADRLDWAMDALVFPAFFLIFITLFSLVLLAIIVLGLAALIWWVAT